MVKSLLDIFFVKNTYICSLFASDFCRRV